MDAVNEFKGEFPCSWLFMCQTSALNMVKPSFKIRESTSVNVNDYHIHLCTKEEFNDLVSQLETNFGKYCYALADYYRRSTDKELLTKPSQPVFTQAMADNEGLPPIGAKVKFVGNDDYLVEFNINDGDELKCICHTKDFEGDSIGVYRHKDGFSVSILNQLIKPIDTRTVKEKAIDSIMESNPAFIRADDLDIRTVLNGAYDKWVGE